MLGKKEKKKKRQKQKQKKFFYICIMFEKICFTVTFLPYQPVTRALSAVDAFILTVNLAVTAPLVQMNA